MPRMPVSTLARSLLVTRSFSTSCPLLSLGCRSVPKPLKAEEAREGGWGQIVVGPLSSSHSWTALVSHTPHLHPHPGLPVPGQANTADPC